MKNLNEQDLKKRKNLNKKIFKFFILPIILLCTLLMILVITDSDDTIILEPEGVIDGNVTAEQDLETYNNYQLFKSSIRSALEPFDGDDVKFGGFALNYGHNYDFSYKVPLNKLPLTDWISAISLILNPVISNNKIHSRCASFN